MRNVIKKFRIILAAPFLLVGCGGPDACDCVEQYEYWSQDGGMYKLDQDLINRCTEYYKDSDAIFYPEDLNTAKKNAKKKCD